jgi:hypothetical protein
MWGIDKRDAWIKENIPTDCSEELKMVLKISMQIAYNQGYLQGKEEICSRVANQQREDMYGPDI